MTDRTRSAPWTYRALTATTVSRMLLAPVVMALVLIADGDRSSAATYAAAALFFIAALTDFVDGRVARHWALATPLGSFLDTTADKLLVALVLFALVGVDHASAPVAAAIVARELVILGLRSAVAVGGTVVEASWLGKIKAGVQFLAILLAILRPGDELAGLFIDEWVMLAAAAITVWSGAEYVAKFAPQIRRPGS
ncbi:MAG TPA: CDP-diacylglycerol--glycerol-3-phosphate 3-phosphatidyltransferase [Baekduia sp.]|nr:CDP-diacylglycerol--glycerol-3-phosphate 3-phosphatidyltransferase [Baekduia sp.]